MQDVDGYGDPYIAPDDRSVGYLYVNDGPGAFTKTALTAPNDGGDVLAVWRVAQAPGVTPRRLSFPGR